MYRIPLICLALLFVIIPMTGCGTLSEGVSGVPTITSVSPSRAGVGSSSAEITISGVNFGGGTTILVNGAARATTYLNKSQLRSVLTSADLARPRVLQISVAAGPAGSGSSGFMQGGPTAIAQSGEFIDFTVAPATLEISPRNLPAAVVYSPYAMTLETSGGVKPYTWNVTAGQLPSGLNLDPATGVLSGTPTKAGQLSFTVQVTGSSSSGSGALQFSLPILPGSAPTAPSSPSGAPELPRQYIDTSMPTQTGLGITVPAGGDFQGALDNARCGDTIELAEGATFTGNFVLSVKDCTGWIVVRTSAPDSALPAENQRITPSYSHVLPKIVSPNSAPAISARFGASYYRFVGVEVTATVSADSEQYGLLDFGEDPATGQSATVVSELPHDITIDRCYIHGTPKGNVKRGITLNGASLAVIDSYISDIHVVGQDTQALLGWNGPGPFKIVDNELEAAGENVMFGGARPALVNNIPSDIEIRGNHFSKPLSWMAGSSSYAGTHWTVKNLLEFKIAQRVLVTGNILENNWVDAQNGFAFLITPRTEYGTAPWVYVQDITFTYNIMRHTASGTNIAGRDSGDPQKLVRGRRILIQNNLFDDINGKAWGGGSGTLFQVLSGADAVTIDHNTGFQSNTILLADGIPSPNLVYQNNITPQNMYGVIGSGYGSGIPTLNHYFPGFVFQKNVLVNTISTGVSASSYPPNTFFPSDWGAARFIDFAHGNYALAPTSPYRNGGTDGKDIGADITSINEATASAIEQ
jgi:hypothetical protein